MGEELSIPRHSIDPRDTIILTPFSGIAFPLEHLIHPAAVAGEDGDGLLTTVSANNGLWRQRQWGGSGAEGADRWGGRWGALGGRAAPPGDRWRRGGQRNQRRRRLWSIFGFLFGDGANS